jgi:Bardet-Biedl syndrome 5 protein
MVEHIWQDREIRFDVTLKQLQPRKGEFQIDSINSVEDTKGNNGEKGAIIVTNLRMIWFCHRFPRTNLSIGFNTVLSTTIRLAHSRLRGNTEALYIMTKYNGTRFEFIFTSLVRRSPRLFTTIEAVFRAYDTTKLYRDLKLRGAIIQDKELLMLPDEEIYDHIKGIWNLSSEQGNLGSFFITNVRVVWHADLAENFNVSIPYMQMESIKIRPSKFGQALVIETSELSGGYVLGFRVDPISKLDEILKEIKSLHEVYSKNPLFGVKFDIEEAPAPLAALTVEKKEEHLEIIEGDETNEPFAAYLAQQGKSVDRDPEFNASLGLAVEKLPDPLTIQELWRVLKT